MLHTLVPAIPKQRLLLETDSSSPYYRASLSGRGLLPHPSPAQAPEPAQVLQVAEEVARLRGETTAQVGEYTTANLKRLLRLEAQ